MTSVEKKLIKLSSAFDIVLAFCHTFFNIYCDPMLTTDCFISNLVLLIFVPKVNEKIPLRPLDCVKLNSPGRRLDF